MQTFIILDGFITYLKLCYNSEGSDKTSTKPAPLGNGNAPLGELEMGNFIGDGNEIEIFGYCLEVTK